MITSYIFDRETRIKKLMYYCQTEKSRSLQEPYFIHVPQGYQEEEINEVFDVSSVWETKLNSMMQHKTQKQDADRVLRKLNQLPKEEHFLVKERDEA